MRAPDRLDIRTALVFEADFSGGMMNRLLYSKSSKINAATVLCSQGTSHSNNSDFWVKDRVMKSHKKQHKKKNEGRLETAPASSEEAVLLEEDALVASPINIKTGRTAAKGADMVKMDVSKKRRRKETTGGTSGKKSKRSEAETSNLDGIEAEGTKSGKKRRKEDTYLTKRDGDTQSKKTQKPPKTRRESEIMNGVAQQMGSTENICPKEAADTDGSKEAADTDDPLADMMVTFVLEDCSLRITKKTSKLADVEEHVPDQVMTRARPYAGSMRPDIVHQTLMTLLDSPLNKAGRLQEVLLLTEDRKLIRISPMFRIPRTMKVFGKVLGSFLASMEPSLQPEGCSEPLMTRLEAPFSRYLPMRACHIALSSHAPLARLRTFVDEGLQNLAVLEVSESQPEKEKEDAANVSENNDTQNRKKENIHVVGHPSPHHPQSDRSNSEESPWKSNKDFVFYIGASPTGQPTLHSMSFLHGRRSCAMSISNFRLSSAVVASRLTLELERRLGIY